jgi:hypothetical protein
MLSGISRWYRLRSARRLAKRFVVSIDDAERALLMVDRDEGRAEFVLGWAKATGQRPLAAYLDLCAKSRVLQRNLSRALGLGR